MNRQMQAALFYARERRKARPIGSNRAPLVTDDVTKGYAVGMTWRDGATNALYRADSVATGAAVWTPI